MGGHQSAQSPCAHAAEGEHRSAVLWLLPLWPLATWVSCSLPKRPFGALRQVADACQRPAPTAHPSLHLHARCAGAGTHAARGRRHAPSAQQRPGPDAGLCMHASGGPHAATCTYLHACMCACMQACITTRKGNKRFAMFDLKITLAWEGQKAGSDKQVRQRVCGGGTTLRYSTRTARPLPHRGHAEAMQRPCRNAGLQLRLTGCDGWPQDHCGRLVAAAPAVQCLRT